MPWLNARNYQYRPNTPLVNTDNGHPFRDGIDFLLALFNRTGGGTGIVNQVTPNAIQAAGSTIDDAASLTHDWNDVTTAAGGQGVQLPQGLQPGTDVTVANSGNHNLNVYPPDGASQIDANGAGAALVVAPGTKKTIQCWTITQFRSGS